jgi:hypothetical protein
LKVLGGKTHLYRQFSKGAEEDSEGEEQLGSAPFY